MSDSLSLTLGAVEMGTMVSAILYGAVSVQAYMYAVGCRKDRAWMKALVAFVWVLETLHIISMISYVYNVTVYHSADPAALSQIKWFVVLNITLSSLVGSPVQAYFTWRAWVVSGKAWYSTPPWAAEFARLMVVLVNCGYLAEEKTLSGFRSDHGYLVTTTLIACLFIDIWNSAVLVYHLRIGFGSIRQYNNIIMWSIETSLVICALAAVSLALWLGMPASTMWLCVLMIHAKVYSLSMLLSLNARIIRKATASEPAVMADPPGSATNVMSFEEKYGRNDVERDHSSEPPTPVSYMGMYTHA